VRDEEINSKNGYTEVKAKNGPIKNMTEMQQPENLILMSGHKQESETMQDENKIMDS
jgi:hypothetical protein